MSGGQSWLGAGHVTRLGRRPCYIVGIFTRPSLLSHRSKMASSRGKVRPLTYEANIPLTYRSHADGTRVRTDMAHCFRQGPHAGSTGLEDRMGTTGETQAVL